jgi:hypothetical protein
MLHQIKDVKIGDRVHVKRLNHTGTIIEIKKGFVYSIDDNKQVWTLTNNEYVEIIDKISTFAKLVLDIVFFFFKRPKIK